MKEIIFNWTNDLTQIETNQKVQHSLSPHFKVQILQSHSTPGIIFTPFFQMQENNYYIVYVKGYSNRDKNAFVWIIDDKHKRLIKNYTFINTSEENDTKACFRAEHSGLFQFGILVTAPKISDYFVLHKILIIEVDKEYITKKTIECGPKKCDDYKKESPYNSSGDESVEEYALDGLDNISHVSSIDYNNLSLGDDATDYDLTTHLGIKSDYDYRKMCEGVELFVADEILQDIVYNSMIDTLTPSNLNSLLPTGFTFFSQFIVHDITNNTPNSLLRRSYLKNTRSPFMDLDSLYGSVDSKNYMYKEGLFLYNYETHDLPRNILGNPIIPDKRNDENYILSQFHLLWLLFHNKLLTF